MAEPNPIQEGGRPRRLTLALLLKRPYGVVGSAIIVIFVLGGVIGPLMTPYDPQDMSITHRLEAPSVTHIFGTDHLGRDVLSRMLRATRLFIYIGLIAVGTGAAAGALSGLALSRGAGKTANFIRGLMRLTASIPIAIFPLWAILNPLTLSVVALAGTGSGKVILVIGIVISLRLMPSFHGAWLPAATATDRGPYDSDLVTSDTTVAKKSLFPLTIAGFGLSVGMAIFLESALSFLALGIPPPDSSLGGMLRVGGRYGGVAAWGTILPGIAVLVGTLGFALLAHSLRGFYEMVVQPERPWFYRTWFLILAFFLWPWPIWSVLIIRSPWHTRKRWKVLGWFLALVEGFTFVAYLVQVPLVAISVSVPILILFVVILMQWDRVRLTTTRRI
jgi:ABC-type dipeptide/oligopeptide/nickel transport system permease subunit